MSAEDYGDVPGLGFSGRHKAESHYLCKFCAKGISFKDRKPFNLDGSPHRCKSKHTPDKDIGSRPQETTLYALAAMNAIINGQIQAGGVDFIHRMNFHDVADAAWQIAAAMASSEKNHRSDFGG